MKIINYLIVLLTLLSCSSEARKTKILPSKLTFNLTDKGGKYIVVRESGYNKTKGEHIIKRVLSSNDSNNEKVLEKSVVISSVGMLKGKVPVLRPKISQFSVWYDKKKYFNELKVNVKTKSMDVKLESPLGKWSGTKSIKFPKGTGVFCYFSQLIECARTTGFISKAINKKNGKMQFFVIMEGYPYISEQYENVPNELFLKASLEFDGVNRLNEIRFTLNIAGQSMFYFLDKNSNFIKKYWVQQGLSLVRSDLDK
jgi:hypothetical protein